MRPWGGKRPTLRGLHGEQKGQRTENEDTARKWAWEYVGRLRSATHAKEWGVKPKRSLAQAAEDYLAHRQQTTAHKTWHNDTAALRHLVAEFGRQRSVQSIDDDELQDWFNKGASVYAPSTLALYAVLIKSFFDWAGHPLKRPQTPPQHAEDPDTLADDEIAALQAACSSEQERKLVNVGLATGGRKAELWALEWQDFRQEHRAVRFSRQLAWPGTGTKGLKGKRSRTALVLPGFLDGMQLGKSGLVIGGRPSEDQASILFRELLKKAGLYRRQRGMHILRHTYARLGMERHKWSIEMLRIFLGHQSIASVEIYAHFGEEAAIRLAAAQTYPREADL